MNRPLPVDDPHLLAAFLAGTPGAFERIVRRHYPSLLRVAEQRCGAGALAEDAVQNALIRAHRYLPRSRGVDNLGAWLRRIVYNCATDLLRSQRGNKVSLDKIVEPAADESADDLELGELRSLVAAEIERLGDVYREPLTLHYLHGISAREIAERLHQNIHSIKSRIARGRGELRRRLAGRLARGGYL